MASGPIPLGLFLNVLQVNGVNQNQGPGGRRGGGGGGGHTGPHGPGNLEFLFAYAYASARFETVGVQKNPPGGMVCITGHAGSTYVDPTIDAGSARNQVRVHVHPTPIPNGQYGNKRTADWLHSIKPYVYCGYYYSPGGVGWSSSGAGSTVNAYNYGKPGGVKPRFACTPSTLTFGTWQFSVSGFGRNFSVPSGATYIALYSEHGEMTYNLVQPSGSTVRDSKGNVVSYKGFTFKQASTLTVDLWGSAITGGDQYYGPGSNYGNPAYNDGSHGPASGKGYDDMQKQCQSTLGRNAGNNFRWSAYVHGTKMGSSSANLSNSYITLKPYNADKSGYVKPYMYFYGYGAAVRPAFDAGGPYTTGSYYAFLCFKRKK